MQNGKLILERAEWARDPERWIGHFDGRAFGTGVTVLFVDIEGVGEGAGWHVHDYDEVFILQEGRARYRVGREVIDAEAGQIVFGPAGIPHRFENLGPGRMRATDIHLAEKWVQTDLPDYDPNAD